jgi:hypothetical protein
VRLKLSVTLPEDLLSLAKNFPFVLFRSGGNRKKNKPDISREKAQKAQKQLEFCAFSRLVSALSILPARLWFGLRISTFSRPSTLGLRPSIGWPEDCFRGAGHAVC